MKITSAIIGMGIGQKHLEAIESSKNSYVKYICEKNSALRKKLKKKYPKKIIIDKPDKIFKDKLINLVSIASYDDDHFYQIMQSLKHDKHVIVEKPMCLSLRELKLIKKLLKKKRKLKITSNLVLRTNSLFQNIKKKIKNKKIYYMECDYLWGRRNKLFGWRSKIDNYSIILGAGIHMIDIAMWILNSKPIYVFATGNKITTKKSNYKKNSFELIILEFPGNIKVKITANGACIYKHFHELKIFTSKETFVHSLNNTFFLESTDPKKNPKFSSLEGKYPDKQNRKKLIQNFVKSLNNSKLNYISHIQLFNLMCACLAAEESSRTKKKIKIKYL